MREHDLIVIGSGSGLSVASGWANRGKDVAVVEPGRMGGTCLNRGCIPSKMLIHRADVAETVRNSEEFHVQASMDGVEFEDMVDDVNDEVREESEQISKGIENSENHTLYDSRARFVEEKVLELEDTGERITAEKIVIAAGTRPSKPPVDGLDQVDYMTSRDALRMDEKPDSVVVIGGGYIACEMAHFWGPLGIDVKIVQGPSVLVDKEDQEVAEKFTEIYSDKFEVHTDTYAEAVRNDDGAVVVETDTEKEISGDKLMVATGRTPNTDTLDLDAADIETDDTGFVEVDEYMQTSVDGVYALGDIAGNYLFKHSANYEANTVFKNTLVGPEFEVDYTAMPHAIFSSPQVAGAGKTEQELEEEDADYVKSTYDYADTGMGGALKEEDGFVKVLTSEEGDILGVHIIGPHASSIIHEALVAMRNDLGISGIKDTIHIHPALNEVVGRAFDQL